MQVTEVMKLSRVTGDSKYNLQTPAIKESDHKGILYGTSRRKQVTDGIDNSVIGNAQLTPHTTKDHPIESDLCDNNLKTKKVKKPVSRKKPVNLVRKSRSELEAEMMEFYNRKLTRSDMLAVRGSPFENVHGNVQKPTEAVIDKGLPSWNNGPIDAKLHVIARPDDTCVISRGKLGDTLWKSCAGGEFVSYDPYGYEVSMPYDPVHDPHLKRYFQIVNNVKPLRSLQLVNMDNDAVCSWKDFNTFRRYLYTIYAENLKNAYKIKVASDAEQSLVKLALNNTMRVVVKQKKIETIVRRRKKYEEIRLKEEHLRQKKLNDRRERYKNVQIKKEAKKREDILKAEQRDAVFRARIHRRCVLAAEIETQRKVDAMVQKKIQDRNFKLKREIKERTRQQENERMIRERWENKVSRQKIELERAQTIRDNREKSLKNNANRRVAINMNQLSNRQEKGKKILKEVELEKERNYLAKKSVTFVEETKSDSNVPRTIQKLVDRYKNRVGRDHFVELFAISEEKVVNIEVLDAIKQMLDSTIKICIRNKVQNAVPKLLQDAISMYETLVRKWQTEKYSSLVGRRQSLLVELQCTIKNATSPNVVYDALNRHQENLIEKHIYTQLVSFGDIEMVPQEEIVDSNIKLVKDREPTPVPSLDSNDEDSVDNIHLGSKLKLDLLLYTLCQKVLNNLETRILSHFFNSGDVASLNTPQILTDKELNIVNYLTSTFIFVVETMAEIDEDECIVECSRYIAKKVLLL